MWSTRYRGSCWSFDQCGDLYQLPTQRLGTAFNELRDFSNLKWSSWIRSGLGQRLFLTFLAASDEMRCRSVQSAELDVSAEQIPSFADDPPNCFRILKNWKQPISFQQPHPTQKCAPTAQIGRRDGPICHSRDLVIDLISKLIFNFLKKEAPPTRVEQGASHAPASWPFRPFELELRNETLTIAFSALDSTWRPNFINFVLSADFLSNFSFISSVNSVVFQNVPCSCRRRQSVVLDLVNRLRNEKKKQPAGGRVPGKMG